MIKNTTIKLVYQTVYVCLAIFGLIGSFGYFEKSFNLDFYVYYTNLSNYICMGVMVACLVQTFRLSQKKEEAYCTVAPTFKFLCVILILVTFLVYNILLAGDKSASEYFSSPSNLLMHLILPLMFIADWIMFYEHGKTKWYHPLLCTVMPLVYVVLVLIRAAIVNGKTSLVVYPYFFLNVDKLGWGGFFAWVSILVVVFVIIGYLFYFFDNFKFFKAKFLEFKLNKKSKKQNNEK